MPNDLEDGLIAQAATVVADDTLAVRVCNVTPDPIDAARRTYGYLVLR